MRNDVAAVGSKGRRMTVLKQTFRSFGTVTGLLATVWTGTIVAAAQDSGYSPAASAPASWQAFAKQLQGRFEQRLVGDDKDARSFQEYLVKRIAEPDAPLLAFVARVWIMPDGKIERLEFDSLNDTQIAIQLRALLTRGNVGSPPPDMLQPLRLRLSLRSQQPKQQGG